MSGMSPTEGSTGVGGERSGRYSDRVESRPATDTENRGRQRFSAPESLTPGGVRLAASAAGSRRPERHQKASSGHRGRRVSRDQLQRARAGLSERDHTILRSLAAHRFLSTSQVQLFHFHDHATVGAASRICLRVLARLADLRMIEPLERRVGGVRAGSESYVWQVGLVGDQVLRLESGDGIRARRKEPSNRWMDHCLAIADTHLALVGAARAGQVELLTVETEPACWRDYLAGSGSRLTLKPDLYAVTVTCDPDGTPGEFEDHLYAEVDLATESLPTLIRKCQQYEAYRRTGRDQHEHGVFPRVVWIVPTEARAIKLRAAIRATRTLDQDLFRVTTPDTFVELLGGGTA
jgi:hypothetical protein